VSPRVLIRRLLGGTPVESDAPVLAGPGRTEQSSLAGLTQQVTVFAAEGASSSEIARRTGLAHDAIALILHYRQPAGAENTRGHGTLRRNAAAPSWGWVADA
jgi:hypothetical protein